MTGLQNNRDTCLSRTLRWYTNLVISLLIVGGMASTFGCQPSESTAMTDSTAVAEEDLPISPAAYQTEAYLPLLQNQRVGMVVNHTSLIDTTHLVDSLLSRGVNITQIFAPEHGFRGEAANGEEVQDATDVRTGLPIVSLYGKNRKPTAEQLAGVDILVFDIQDVGARFYTYISTMHYVMEACAELNKPMVILDRPNPNGFYIGGPIREPEQKSFLGMHPIPIAHGLTVGELAQMINGEVWLTDSMQCDITVIPVENYSHADHYSLPMRPSPNLPNDQAINLYPSLCLFEATSLSLGRGTEFPFQVLGNPNRAIQQSMLAKYPSFDSIQFTPQDIPGVAFDTKHRGELCYGVDLRNIPRLEEFTLEFLIDFYQQAKAHGMTDQEFIDRPDAFALLAGNKTLQKQIEEEKSMKEIKQSWEPELSEYKVMRKKYLLYEDFE
ncbi:MAG: exo-beta-N-acetylmuramidase NamZ domain-containing protein [Cyclobacteriaceae bacterium]